MCSTKLESENLFTNLASKLSAHPRQASGVRRKRLAARSSAAKQPQMRFAAARQIAVTLTLGQVTLTLDHPSLTLVAISEAKPNPSFRARPRAAAPPRARKSGLRG